MIYLQAIQIIFIEKCFLTKYSKIPLRCEGGELMNSIVLIVGVLFLGLILIGVYNVVVRKKKVENMYTPFDDATKGIKNDDRGNKE